MIYPELIAQFSPSTEISSVNNVGRITKTSLMPRRKRSNSELSVDSQAPLASTAIAKWDHNGQHSHSHRRKMSNTSREDRWLEKYNQLKEFYQKHGRIPVTYFNRAPKSLAYWVNKQRHCCKMESRIKLLNAIGFVWIASEALEDQQEDRWLEKYNQLKRFYQKHGHTQVPSSADGDNSLYKWVFNQHQRCKIMSRIKLLKSIGFVWSPRPHPEAQEDQCLRRKQRKSNGYKSSIN